MIEDTIRVSAEWDLKAGAYLATTRNLVGLVAGFDTVDGLMIKLRSLEPEMLNLNELSDVGVNPTPDCLVRLEPVARRGDLAPAHG